MSDLVGSRENRAGTSCATPAPAIVELAARFVVPARGLLSRRGSVERALRSVTLAVRIVPAAAQRPRGLLRTSMRLRWLRGTRSPDEAKRKSGAARRGGSARL